MNTQGSPLRTRKPHTESTHTQLHGTDLAHLPFAGNLKWIIEFPPAWEWFVTWAPGQIPQHFKESSSYPGPSSNASAPASSRGSPFNFSPPTETMAASASASCQVSFDNPPSFPAPAAPMPSAPSFRMQPCAQPAMQHVDNFLGDDQDMPDQPPTIVETVIQQLFQPQATDISLDRTWHIRPNEHSKRYMAQPVGKTRMESAQPATPQLETVLGKYCDTTSQPTCGLLQMAISRLLQHSVQEMPQGMPRMLLALMMQTGMSISESRLRTSIEMA